MSMKLPGVYIVIYSKFNILNMHPHVSVSYLNKLQQIEEVNYL